MKVLKKAKIAIVGGGVAGASVALTLGELGLDVTLFEKKKRLVDGPPICHLHAGGNLYREISDAQCLQLLRESIDFVRLYPHAIDLRPTVIALPLVDKGRPEELCKRLNSLQEEYARLVKSNAKNEVLGSVDNYFKTFDRESIESLKQLTPKEKPKSFDEWMIPVAQMIDLESVQFPLVMVQEYGINIFRLASSVALALENISKVRVFTQTEVTSILQKDAQWELLFTRNGEEIKESFDYLINAAGFKSGSIDDMLGFVRERYVEFKAAYITKWKNKSLLPEIIFYGERGTPQGMAQFTPYPNGYIQLHGMTEEITLFEDGLVQSSSVSSQPQLDKKFIDKIYKGWSRSASQMRSKLAIKHMSQFIPSFKDAKVASKPFYGAQQIPGSDASLRAAEVSFDGKRYARCEIVKASSVLSMADAICEKLVHLGYLKEESVGKREFPHIENLEESSVSVYAKILAKEREYPQDMAGVNNRV